MTGIGLQIKCMDEEFSHGLTEENTKESILRIKSKGREFLFGQTTESMREAGLKENSTGKEYTLTQRKLREKGNGTMESD